MSIVALFKNCFEHLKGKFQKNYISAQTPKQYSQKKVLVLDLDETLVHCEFKENENFQHEVLLEVIHKGQLYKVYLKARPYLNQFLQEASKDYEIFIFTAGYEAYCQEVLSFIDKKKIISDYYARGSCQFIDGICYKDLQLIDRPMGDIIFIDNNPNAFIKCQDNGLLIPSFLDSEDDDCLLRLIPFLKYMAKKKDLRPVEQHLKIYEDNNGIVEENHKYQRYLNIIIGIKLNINTHLTILQSSVKLKNLYRQNKKNLMRIPQVKGRLLRGNRMLQIWILNIKKPKLNWKLQTRQKVNQEAQLYFPVQKIIDFTTQIYLSQTFICH